MGIAKKTDGRYVVGVGVTDGNEYKGSAAWRDMVIQLTADGATEQSLEYLTYLKDYAIYHSALGEPIMPPGKNVWISNNGTTTAVEADDLSFTDDTFTICGITFSGDAWDFSNAGQGGGSSLPSYDVSDKGKVLTIAESGDSVAPSWETPSGGGIVFVCPDGLAAAASTLAGNIVTYIATNSKTNLVSGRTVYNGSDSADISQAIRDVADACAEGKHATCKIFDGNSTVTNCGKGEIGGTLSFVVAKYNVGSPLNKDFTIFVKVTTATEGGEVMGLEIEMAMQVWDKAS